MGRWRPQRAARHAGQYMAHTSKHVWERWSSRSIRQSVSDQRASSGTLPIVSGCSAVRCVSRAGEPWTALSNTHSDAKTAGWSARTLSSIPTACASSMHILIPGGGDGEGGAGTGGGGGEGSGDSMSSSQSHVLGHACRQSANSSSLRKHRSPPVQQRDLRQLANRADAAGTQAMTASRCSGGGLLYDA